MTAPTKTAEIIRWEDPPPSRSKPADRQRGSRYDRVATALQCKPGRSAVVFVGIPGTASSIAAMIRTGRVSCFGPPGDFNACTRAQEDGTYAVYAWYVGGGEPW